MAKHIKISWFEIPVSNMQRAMAFYTAVFEVKINLQNFGDLEMAWLPPSSEPGAASGTLIKQESYIPSGEGALLYFGVADAAVELGRVEKAGGKIYREKTEIGEGHGFMAVFIDTEGNRVALHSNK